MGVPAIEPYERTARKLTYAASVAASWVETVVGADRHGEWAVLRAGAPVYRSSGTVLRYRSHQVFCYPRDRWWVARFGGPDAIFEAHRRDGTVRLVEDAEPDRVDISMPAVVSPGGIAFVDLILDVVRHDDGTVVIQDEEEVDELAERLAISAEEIEAARRSCEEVAAAMRTRAVPFDGSAARWLRAFVTTSAAGLSKLSGSRRSPAPSATASRDCARGRRR